LFLFNHQLLVQNGKLFQLLLRVRLFRIFIEHLVFNQLCYLCQSVCVVIPVGLVVEDYIDYFQNLNPCPTIVAHTHLSYGNINNKVDIVLVEHLHSLWVLKKYSYGLHALVQTINWTPVCEKQQLLLVEIFLLRVCEFFRHQVILRVSLFESWTYTR